MRWEGDQAGAARNASASARRTGDDATRRRWRVARSAPFPASRSTLVRAGPTRVVGLTEPEPSWCSLPEDSELVAQGHDLHFAFGPRSEAGPNGGKQGSDAWAHTAGGYQQKSVSSIATRSTEFLIGTTSCSSDLR